MIELTGANLIAGRESAAGTNRYFGVDPKTGSRLDTGFAQATDAEIDAACLAAMEAFRHDRDRSAAERASLLEAVAEVIEVLGDQLLDRVMAETALPKARVQGERGRTTGQLRLFASLVREGSWVDARIDTALPDRAPAPRPDLRRMLRALGPVAVFGASNFPLAFSVAGGDTASALAAGCPVVVKAHPSHPGTSELVGRAIMQALRASDFHPGNFSLIHGTEPAVSRKLVTHPFIRAVGFTGSLRAGRALHDAAAARPEPIPVYAEMGSVNPMFILPGALSTRRESIVRGLIGSVTLGAGQFCTNPGLVFVLDGADAEAFVEDLAQSMEQSSEFTLLNEGICRGYAESVQAVADVPGVRIAGKSASLAPGPTAGQGFVMETTADAYLANDRLHEEVFGPTTLVVRCPDARSLTQIAESLEGNLTATIHASDEEIDAHGALAAALVDRVGRLIFNGFPTGVEVSSAMNHGGPYPASTDVRSTSVGTAAIYRFARPICYQSAPSSSIPPELQDGNPRGLWRTVNGEYGRH